MEQFLKTLSLPIFMPFFETQAVATYVKPFTGIEQFENALSTPTEYTFREEHRVDK
jgi:hypothetical protein